jgi:hypothetical protein
MYTTSTPAVNTPLIERASPLLGPASGRAGGVLRDGLTIAVGDFGLSEIPAELIEAVRDAEVREPTIVSNNMGVDGKGRAAARESSGPEGLGVLYRREQRTRPPARR